MTTADIPASSGCPPVAGVLTMFYYRDMERALAWYESVMGWPHAMTLEHAAVLRINETSRLVLVGHGQGSQRPLPGDNKGALLSLEVADLEDWHARLIARGVLASAIVTGAGGLSREFKVKDPEDYTIEFLRWL